MLVRSWIYLTGETVKSLFRNAWMSIASAGVVALTLLLLGSFILLNNNVTLITENIKDQVEIVVYVREGAEEEEVAHLRQQLIRHPQVAEVRYVSRHEALSRLKAQFGEQSHLLAGYEDDSQNPLRDSFEVKTKVPETIGEVALDFYQYPWVAEVYYGSHVVDNLFRFTSAVKLVGLAFMIALAVTATFLIAHTIRLNVVLRSREIMIMKYVGATDWFIRWPFVMEGLVLGFTGALMPLVALYYGYQAVAEWASSYIYFVPIVAHEAAVHSLVLILLPLGVGLGMLGSMFSVRRFLRV